MKERSRLKEPFLKKKKEKSFSHLKFFFSLFLPSFFFFSVESLLLISSQITEGMSYLEDLGVVHRDLAAR